MKGYGHFNKSGDEYIITDYMTPRPQLNYVWNARMLSGINHFGGGEGAYVNRAASYIDPEGRTRATLIRDGNRYFYIRDEKTGEFWNPGWYPSKTDVENYSCVHGIGYSKISAAKNGITSTALGFVGTEDPAELWELSLENTTEEEKQLKVYSFIEFSLEGYARYSEYDSYVFADYHEKEHMVYATNTAQERPYPFFDGYVASDVAPTGFDSSQKSFLGNYGNINAPEVVVKGQCTSSKAACELMVGVLEHTITLAPHEKQAIHYLFGSSDSVSTATNMIHKLLAKGEFERQLSAVKAEKKAMQDRIIVQTPVEKINYLTNYWLKNQVQLCCEAGRSTGKGFRDQLQDSWGIAAFNQELAKQKIIETLREQYSDGRCPRGWMPLDHHIYSDGPTWIAPTINAYIKETGDFDFLDMDVPYLDEGSATVWGHILLSVRYSSEDLGAHQLTLAHDGDWNDSLNGIGTAGKGESVWTSIALCMSLQNAADIAKNVKHDSAVYDEMMQRYEKLKTSINANAWDGKWYLAAFNDLGDKVGTHTEKEGYIYLNSQTWAILAGVCEGERQKTCLESIDTELDSPYGPLTLYPAYKKYNPNIGRLTGFVPGIWENSAPYCHGGSFKIVADCLTGRGDKALETLMKIMPDSEMNPSTHSGCEPYVFTNMYLGPENPRAGETSGAWVTGTAGWMFRAVTQYMLGFHPGYDSFSLRPVLPASWKECSIQRKYRKDIYEISIHNPNGKQTGAIQLVVDGKPIEGNEVPIFNDGKTHSVDATIA